MKITRPKSRNHI
nr:TPA_asm: m06 uORF RNA *1 [Murid betaherpesvirus 1]DBA07707.1 TPA_asm: m06 uORF RNA *1 [Murid betaherpesvirus 1]